MYPRGHVNVLPFRFIGGSTSSFVTITSPISYVDISWCRASIVELYRQPWSRCVWKQRIWTCSLRTTIRWFGSFLTAIWVTAFFVLWFSIVERQYIMFEENTKELLSIPVKFRPDFESKFCSRKKISVCRNKDVDWNIEIGRVDYCNL